MAEFNFGKMLGLSAPKSQYRDTQASVLPSMQARQPIYKGIQQRGTAMAGQFHPQQVQSGQSLVDYYNAGPDAGGMNAANASMLRGQDSGYAAAGARLKALGARTGADTSGAVATLEGNRVASAFPIQQSMAARRQAEIERFKRGAMLTTGQLAGQGASIEAQGLQGGQSLDNQLFGTAGQLASADEARKQATYQRIMAFAQQAGQMAGGASGGRSAPQEPTHTGDFAAAGQAQMGQNLQRLRSPAPDPEFFDPYGQSDGYDYTYYPGRY